MEKTGDRVLVIGGGGREHALSWCLSASKRISHVYVSPGNVGTHSSDPSAKISNTVLDLKSHSAVAAWCKEQEIALVVVGPEDPLADGISDHLNAAGVPCFGPSAKAAEIESSKAFAKDFMEKYGIATARGKHFSSLDEAQNFINSADFPALVVKASGLAAGKGVIVAESKQEACKAVSSILEDKLFGKAGQTVLVEERLEGPEISVLGLSDGKSVVCLPPVQDHKRLEEGDHGPNTGGMGAYAPCPLVTSEQLKEIQKGILQKAIDGMREEGKPYVGVLYAGLMLTKEGPKVLEFNCRFGDPETQVLLPLLKSDLYDLLWHCVKGTLAAAKMELHADRSCVAVVCISDGYPNSYKKGMPISGFSDFVNDKDKLVFHAGTKLGSDNCILANGGRVLATVAVGNNLAVAAKLAQLGAQAVKFEGKKFRSDIAHQAIPLFGKLSYSSAGVDIDAGESLVDRIKPVAAATSRPGCKAELGGFGGIFDLKAAGYRDPLLVSGTDGVGTKLKVAQMCGLHNTVGIDLVAMCVNDILCQGAEPLFFLDYFACGKLDVGVAAKVIEGVAQGCKLAGAALLGGETAEMPGMYSPGDYDLAGFAVGAVERSQYLPRTSEMAAGDILIGLPSSGLHSNGFSLVRRLVDCCGFTYDMTCPFDGTKKLGEALLTPTRIYTSSLMPVLWLGKIKAIAHITGGGLPGNVCRVLPDHLTAKMDALKWPMPPVYTWIASKGNVDVHEMARTFNCGLGLVLVTAKDDKEKVIDQLEKAGETAVVVGELTSRQRGMSRIVVNHLKEAFDVDHHRKHRAPCAEEEDLSDAVKRLRVNGVPHKPKKKVGVLISGSGTNLQALIDHTTNPGKDSAAVISLVISNKSDALGLKRAEAAGIQTMVINHKDFASRALFDEALHDALVAADVEIVCLAGFMRILTGKFVSKWTGRMLNVHPSLLPAFKGANAHQMVLEARVCISGCSVHFVVEEVDGGAILVQESVPVLPNDTEVTLAERVKAKEHEAFPHALELLASGRVMLGSDGKAIWQN
ncbi:hypothetical protein CAPTEDRAFT_90257 [Capitella teleta]|uniref:Trifunctional purine biosynthetic protein adenosine-3 n=1 Tax=Capitella teleta TaxID=283909 RepID=R7V1B8_CAPTE|nr:hypothetical protein CAPTEDRAFT_90257 [Capitella teleta]|eukprot:ELU12633.1 hypothetical protein CAPTEDRAFT_90257 [Capitella teleta]